MLGEQTWADRDRTSRHGCAAAGRRPWILRMEDYSCSACLWLDNFMKSRGEISSLVGTLVPLYTLRDRYTQCAGWGSRPVGGGAVAQLPPSSDYLSFSAK